VLLLLPRYFPTGAYLTMLTLLLVFPANVYCCGAGAGPRLRFIRIT